MDTTSLDDARANGYPLDLRDVLRDAAAALSGSKRVILAGALAWLAISVVMGLLTLAIGLPPAPSAAIGVLATAPLTVGLVMAGARRAAGLSLAMADLWAYTKVTAQAAIVLLINLVVVLGGEAILGPVFSLPLTFGYGLFASLALYLVADRELDAGRAIGASAQLVAHHWGKLLALQLLLGSLLGLAAIPLGIGLIWAGPFAIIAQGAVYARAVGVGGRPPTTHAAAPDPG